jgi:hypothetical protein
MKNELATTVNFVLQWWGNVVNSGRLDRRGGKKVKPSEA